MTEEEELEAAGFTIASCVGFCGENRWIKIGGKPDECVVSYSTEEALAIARKERGNVSMEGLGFRMRMPVRPQILSRLMDEFHKLHGRFESIEVSKADYDLVQEFLQEQTGRKAERGEKIRFRGKTVLLNKSLSKGEFKIVAVHRKANGPPEERMREALRGVQAVIRRMNEDTLSPSVLAGLESMEKCFRSVKDLL